MDTTITTQNTVQNRIKPLHWPHEQDTKEDKQRTGSLLYRRFSQKMRRHATDIEFDLQPAHPFSDYAITS